MTKSPPKIPCETPCTPCRWRRLSRTPNCSTIRAPLSDVCRRAHRIRIELAIDSLMHRSDEEDVPAEPTPSARGVARHEPV